MYYIVILHSRSLRSICFISFHAHTLTSHTQTYVNLLPPPPSFNKLSHHPYSVTPHTQPPSKQKKNRNMANEQASKTKGILDRLTRLEHSQNEMMQRLKSDHESQMRELRDKLERANQKRREAENHLVVTDSAGQPLLMEVNMTEVEAAVQAASFAEQESALALEEARKLRRTPVWLLAASPSLPGILRRTVTSPTVQIVSTSLRKSRSISMKLSEQSVILRSSMSAVLSVARTPNMATRFIVLSFRRKTLEFPNLCYSCMPKSISQLHGFRRDSLCSNISRRALQERPLQRHS